MVGKSLSGYQYLFRIGRRPIYLNHPLCDALLPFTPTGVVIALGVVVQQGLSSHCRRDVIAIDPALVHGVIVVEIIRICSCAPLITQD
jgi:hypothetical protein